LSFNIAILNQHETPRIKTKDDDLRKTLEDVVSENAVLAGVAWKTQRAKLYFTLLIILL